MKSCKGVAMTLGQGAENSKLIKQKLNTKSSTKDEFVGVDDMRYFINAQN